MMLDLHDQVAAVRMQDADIHQRDLEIQAREAVISDLEHVTPPVADCNTARREINDCDRVESQIRRRVPVETHVPATLSGAIGVPARTARCKSTTWQHEITGAFASVNFFDNVPAHSEFERSASGRMRPTDGDSRAHRACHPVQ